ncbi:MAG: hypothetical protein QG656_940, partial [Candidatus Hydrogenedentes bacterium]|nr:hypothetical protein [Candidatus Hydrogenedentota bacterium]
MRIRRTFLVLAAALVAIVAVGCGSQKTEAATQSPAPAAPAAAPAPTPSPEAEPAAAPAAEAPPTTTSSGGTLSEIAPGVMNFKPETPAKDPAERAKRLADLKAQWLKEARAEKSEPGSTQWALTGT